MEKKIQKIFILIAEIMIIAAFIIAGLIILVRKNEKMDREMELRRAVKCVGNNLYIKKLKIYHHRKVSHCAKFTTLSIDIKKQINFGNRKILI